jgi:ubiquitin C-terminal hydrolase
MVYPEKGAINCVKEGSGGELQDQPNTRMKKIKKIPSGLINLGNSCYLSSVLQLLASAEEFLIDHFINCGRIGQELAKVLKEINEGNYPVRPNDFIKSFTGSVEFSRDQQDAHEFLLALLNLKLKKTSTRFEESPLSIASIESLKVITSETVQKQQQRHHNGIFKIQNYFTGVLMNELICLPCAIKRKQRHVSSLRIEPYSCVTLTPTSMCTSINESVYKQFCEPERFSDYSNYMKDGGKCGLGAINQKNPLILPELLFLHVSMLSELLMKTDQKIETALELSGPGYRYKLLSLVVHFGSNGLSGHFICYRRHGRGRGWIKCDDSKIIIIKESEVLSQRAYLLLYQKE